MTLTGGLASRTVKMPSRKSVEMNWYFLDSSIIRNFSLLMFPLVVRTARPEA